MSDFKKMADDARARSEAIVKEKDRERLDRERAEAMRLKHAQTSLRNEVEPTLRSAAAAFEETGIIASIKENTGFSASVKGIPVEVAILTFRCCQTNNDPISDHKRTICGKSVRFEHDGTTLRITKEEHGMQKRLAQSVDQAIQYALESFWQAMRAET